MIPHSAKRAASSAYSNACRFTSSRIFNPVNFSCFSESANTFSYERVFFGTTGNTFASAASPAAMHSGATRTTCIKTDISQVPEILADAIRKLSINYHLASYIMLVDDN
ncbi:hypothetical protein BATDEDRAFT_92861 [Batrachochytrium dendrobatidis JAM81]|uniref:Uncharacterized protein n=2 Tax=Batrachochytrium dendrobatidis TaxID=109871 RepID=F4PEM4_BATDJ|nr:uncharacterized protein BATDEDRAFT_92861 [Batrachochytrium dendrobatidis JAM81]EGF76272.1 hypothetical protein BATDEDRAFT_92861 [Batrachochytrium dendrobatidis JAM81]KAJ8323664.1 hypothetical protein O5D80_007552 [Batrachochytrium dendrobatidis]KAK5666416.1 hypothetical protein QVD99_007172 [Batrachochytrium dendrobatidis]OAJ43026.1 hypothetical protein BDEG_26409 [Batrachochytrium dendrobatidis JEL423]|eukprot:XP_006683100.1 hypothetical protein BATDEDRAFT_92861 [Batrachochytrium dendrobatidis JAM81]